MKFKLLILFCLLSIISVGQIQPNNTCGSAATLPVNSSCVNNTFTMPSTFTNDGYVLTGCNIGNTRDDGWYKFQATSIVTEINVVAAQDIIIHVYSGTCGAFTLMGCSDVGLAGIAETVNIPTTVGVWYYIRIQRYNSSSGITSGNICVYNTTNCNWTLCLQDTYGDGWNNAYLQVFVDGVSIGYAELLSGAGPVCYMVPAQMSGNVSIVFTSGLYDEECFYAVYTDLGILYHSELVMPANYSYLQTCNGSLPLELAQFNVTCDNGRVIEWSTYSEQNTDFFIVKSSEDGMFFSNIVDVVPAAGNSSTLQSYNTIDNLVYNDNTIYYELEEHDNSGYVKVLGIRSSTCDLTSSDINIYPNPSYVGEPITVKGDYKTIEIYNLLGQKVKAELKGIQLIGLPSGVYILWIDGKLQAKLVIY